MLGNSNRRLLIILQCLQPAGLIGWAILKIYGEFVIFNTNYAFDGWIVHLLPFFLKKRWKAGPREKWCGFLFFVKKKTEKKLARMEFNHQTHSLY